MRPVTLNKKWNYYLVERCQSNFHNATCYKYWKGPLEPKQCRFSLTLKTLTPTMQRSKPCRPPDGPCNFFNDGLGKMLSWRSQFLQKKGMISSAHRRSSRRQSEIRSITVSLKETSGSSEMDPSGTLSNLVFFVKCINKSFMTTTDISSSCNTTGGSVINSTSACE